MNFLTKTISTIGLLLGCVLATESYGKGEHRTHNATDKSLKSRPSRTRGGHSPRYASLGIEPAQATVSATRLRKHRTSHTMVGFMSGMNFSFAKAIPEESGKTRNAMAFAAHIDTRLSSRFSFFPEISYMQRGVQTTILNVGQLALDGNIKLDYMELAPMLKANFTWGRRWVFHLMAGPRGAIAVSRNVEVLGLVDVNLNDRFADFDLGFNAGAGVAYRVGRNTSLITNIRGTFGLIDIDLTETEYYTRGALIMVGIQVGL